MPTDFGRITQVLSGGGVEFVLVGGLRRPRCDGSRGSGNLGGSGGRPGRERGEGGLQALQERLGADGLGQEIDGP